MCIFLKKIVPYLEIKKISAQNAIPNLEKQLVEMKNKKMLYEKRKRRAKRLRLKGLDYRTIGKALGIDWGYARRLALDLV